MNWVPLIFDFVVENFSIKKEICFDAKSLALIEAVTPQQALGKALARGVRVESRFPAPKDFKITIYHVKM